MAQTKPSQQEMAKVLGYLNDQVDEVKSPALKQFYHDALVTMKTLPHYVEDDTDFKDLALKNEMTPTHCEAVLENILAKARSMQISHYRMAVLQEVLAYAKARFSRQEVNLTHSSSVGRLITATTKVVNNRLAKTSEDRVNTINQLVIALLNTKEQDEQALMAAKEIAQKIPEQKSALRDSVVHAVGRQIIAKQSHAEINTVSNMATILGLISSGYGIIAGRWDYLLLGPATMLGDYLLSERVVTSSQWVRQAASKIDNPVFRFIGATRSKASNAIAAQADKLADKLEQADAANAKKSF